MTPLSLNRLTIVLVGLALAPSILLEGQVATKEIKVISGRPLAEAALQLEQELGIPINYEDIRLSPQSGFVVDVTKDVMNAEQKARNPNAQILVPKGGELSVVAVTNAATGKVADGLGTLNSLVSAHLTKGYPGTYQVESVHGMLYIAPVQAPDQTGHVTPVKSVLASLVTIPFATRDATELLRLILDQVERQSGYKIALAVLPMNAFIRTQVTEGAKDEPARDVIARLFTEVASREGTDGMRESTISFQLRFDPRLQYYLFSAHVVAPSRPGPNSLAQPSQSGAIAPAAPANTWFLKRAQ